MVHQANDPVESAWDRDISGVSGHGRAHGSKGFSDVRKIREAATAPDAPQPATIFQGIHNLRDEVARKPEGPTQTMVLQRKFSDNFFGKIAKNKYFEAATICIIVLNALAIGVDADYSARFETPANLYEGPVYFIITETFFAVYFTIEILIRFLAYRQKCQCLRDRWFVFDSILVSLMVWETWIMPFIGGLQGLGQLSILRLLRLLRITRMAKLMRAFPQLLMILKGITAAARAVAWTAVLLVIISFTWSILFTNEYHQGYLTDDELAALDDADPRKIHEYFGSMDKSMLTLLIMGTILDDVTECSDIIRTQNNYWMLAAFICYIVLNSFMMLNMLVGILVEVVGSTSEAESTRASKEQATDAIMTIFTSMDSDGSGLITKDEFSNMKYDSDVMAALLDLGIKDKQFDMYVQLLYNPMGLPDSDDTNPGVAMGLESLVEALCRLRPGAAVNLLDWSTFKTSVLKSEDELQERIRKLYKLFRKRRRSVRTLQEANEVPGWLSEGMGSKRKINFQMLSDLQETPSSEIITELQRRLGVPDEIPVAMMDQELFDEITQMHGWSD